MTRPPNKPELTPEGAAAWSAYQDAPAGNKHTVSAWNAIAKAAIEAAPLCRGHREQLERRTAFLEAENERLRAELRRVHRERT